jgi:ATP-dependent Clp protease protease subunit
MINRIKEKVNTMFINEEPTAMEEDPKVILVNAAPEGAPEPELRVVGLYTDITEEKVAEVTQALLYLNETNRLKEDEEEKKPIDFYISTYGGNADDMFALYDIMKQVQKETEIHTIGMGKVMSAGVLLLAGGTPGHRKIGKNCRIMLHSVSSGNHGDLHNLVNEVEAIQELQEMYINCLTQETKMTKSQLKKMLERKVNVYLSAEQAVEYGIADKVL